MEDRIGCLQCHQRISEVANYCENCGSKVSSVAKRDGETVKSGILDEPAPTKANTGGQMLIFTGLMVLCSSTLYYFVLGAIVDITDKWELYDTVEPFSLFVSVLSAGIALVIALGLNAGPRKTLAVIFACLYTLIHLYWFIDRLIPDEPAFEFLQF